VDAPKIAREVHTMLTEDPLEKYFGVSPREARKIQTVRSFMFSLDLTIHIRRKTGWVIGDCDAFICFSDASARESKFDKWLDNLTNKITRLESRAWTEEQTKRINEFKTKVRKVVPEALGKRTKTMLYLDHVATMPDKQGRGYGTALCKILSEKV